ncbi:SUMF1/EgtB/PvdO family nonheme iron enzyme [Ancylomarina sp. YFZ004]
MKTRFILLMFFIGSIMNFTNCSKDDDDDVKNTPPSAPNLKFPADEAIEQESSITLDWGDSVDPEKDEVSYNLYFSESQGELDDNIEVSNLKTSSYQLNDLQYSTNYYWKAIAKDTKGASSSSSIFSFTTKTNSTLTDIEMVAVQGGTFQMGSNYSYSEKPIHTVTLSSFAIGKYEVTQAQWVAVMGSYPSNWRGDNLPVERVSWNTIQTFITKLNELTGLTYRLPTEAEWEFAARGGSAGSATTYAGSNTIGDVAWYNINSGSKTHEVGTKQPNELGIYDMAGNVWEWCNDWYGSYGSDAVTNPTGPASGSYRVLRGGGWYGSPYSCSVAYRFNYSPSQGSHHGGFRLLLVQ